MFRSPWHEPLQDPLAWIDTVLPWIHEAQQPYCDWAYGDAETARELIQDWMARESSEMSLSRSILLFEGEAPVACLIGMPGAQIQQCRRADAEALALELGGGPEADEVFSMLVEASSALFPRPNDDDFFVSSIGVDPNTRGRGYGKKIVQSSIDVARSLGLPRVRLDVCRDNHAALRLYTSLGFVVDQEGTSDEAELTYRALSVLV